MKIDHNFSSFVLGFAMEEHAKVNQKYDKYLPYGFHLKMAYNIAMKYINLIPEEDQETVLAAVACHDILEDTPNTYNDLRNAFLNMPVINSATNQVLSNETIKEICEIVYAVTNEKGRNRKERVNDKYYEGIKAVKYATFVKLCDRMANVLYGMMSRGESEMYQKELSDFLSKLYSEELNNYTQILNDLGKLFTAKTYTFSSAI